MEPIVPTKKLEPGVFQGSPVDTTAPKEQPLRLIRTMKSDMAEAAKVQNETLVSIALAEEKKQAVQRAEGAAQKDNEMQVTPPPKPLGRIVIILVILLVIGGVVSAYVFLRPKLSTIQIPSVAIPNFGTQSQIASTTIATSSPKVVAVSFAPSMIPVQFEKRITIDGATIASVSKEISNERLLGLPNGVVKHLYFEETTADANSGSSKKPVSISRLFILTGIFAPASTARALETPFMVGLIGEEGSRGTPFLVFSTTGYDTGIAGMLAWEEKLPQFLGALFGGNQTGTSLPMKFHSATVSDHDIRIATAASSTIAYTFTGTNKVVIAASQTALEKLLSLVK